MELELNKVNELHQDQCKEQGTCAQAIDFKSGCVAWLQCYCITMLLFKLFEHFGQTFQAKNNIMFEKCLLAPGLALKL